MLNVKSAFTQKRPIVQLIGQLRYFSESGKLSTSSSTTAAEAPAAERTALYDFHLQLKGKIVNFGGYLLPVQYGNDSISASHLHTRQWGSIFDVSHMLQTYVEGKAAIACIESICTADLVNAPIGSAALTCFTNTKGGILDDLIVTKVSNNRLYIVSNAAMKAQDMQLMKDAAEKYRNNGKDVNIEFLSVTDQSLIAVQGPKAVDTISQLTRGTDTENLKRLYFMNSIVANVAGIPDCRITRCGYTGEDGVEISVPSTQVKHLTELLLHQKLSAAKNGEDRLKMAGLGCRDTLRLEAGLCLYGSDLNANITPIEAGLNWLVAKRRRQTLDFPGAQHILAQINKQEPLNCRRFGLIMAPATQQSGAPAARHGVQIRNETNGDIVGTVTSGCPSPTLNRNIAMAYWHVPPNVPTPALKADTKLQLIIRGKTFDAKIAKMPFVPTKYKLQPKTTK